MHCLFHPSVQITGLRSLHLSTFMLPDVDVAWRCLGGLTCLTELRVSFPFDSERLKWVLLGSAPLFVLHDYFYLVTPSSLRPSFSDPYCKRFQTLAVDLSSLHRALS